MLTGLGMLGRLRHLQSQAERRTRPREAGWVNRMETVLDRQLVGRVVKMSSGWLQRLTGEVTVIIRVVVGPVRTQSGRVPGTEVMVSMYGGHTTVEVVVVDWTGMERMCQ